MYASSGASRFGSDNSRFNGGLRAPLFGCVSTGTGGGTGEGLGVGVCAGSGGTGGVEDGVDVDSGVEVSGSILSHFLLPWNHGTITWQLPG